MGCVLVFHFSIIPLREKIGNYDLMLVQPLHFVDYTTTRENWELRRCDCGV